ncbi:hypothetical protein EYF80_034796 [Liparis tanakae]|uniref:Uncharacterized protein n=1 Tax=Liparis tanakae TaxID=230148 RepID=A0A4Z2GNT2_9TELE|nr:hypothetical protein EYF80_034796 [Liparis tanakae]
MPCVAGPRSKADALGGSQYSQLFRVLASAYTQDLLPATRPGMARLLGSRGSTGGRGVDDDDDDDDDDDGGVMLLQMSSS